MRMRRKKHLEDRLSACDGYIFYMDMEDRDYNQAKRFRKLIDPKEMFHRDAPLQMEIGCGKGQFICELAKRFPNKDFIAVEKSSNVIVDAAEKAMAEGITNVKFFRGGAEYLPCFIPENSIELIYLNFSCPYPKKSYASHRLTHSRFLKIYELLLKDGGEIHQKTDNRSFFEFSLESLSQFGFTLKNISLDLHNSGFEGNIVTEYEKRFSEQGFPIYRLEAFMKK